jgi:hypothetical protein
VALACAVGRCAGCIHGNHNLANDTPRLLNTPLPTVQGSSGNLEAGFECLEEFYPYKQLLRRSTGSADQCKGMPCHGKAGLGVLLCSVMGSNGGHDDVTAYCSNNVFDSKPGRTVSCCDPPPRLASRRWFPIWNRPMVPPAAACTQCGPGFFEAQPCRNGTLNGNRQCTGMSQFQPRFICGCLPP